MAAQSTDIPVPQVGVAGYFVDIGIKHPEWPHGFILGVECDGATYHSSRSARDRDRLREEVLGRLGWKLHRIWSTDWFTDPGKEALRLRSSILARLAELKNTVGVAFAESASVPERATPEEAWRTKEAVSDELQPEELTSSSEEESVAIGVGDRVRVRYLTGSGNTLEVALSNTKNDPQNGIVHVSEPLGTALIGAEQGDEIEVLVGSYVRRALIERVTKSDGSIPFRRPADAPPVSPSQGELYPPSTDTGKPKTVDDLDPDQFYESGYRKVIHAYGVQIIDRRGPVTFRHLCDLIARAHGFQRTGSQIKRQVWATLSKSRKSSKSPNGETVFWPKGSDPRPSVAFRGLDVDGYVRVWSDVPYPEKLGLAIAVLRGRRVTDPTAAIAANIGLTRLRQTTRDELETLVSAARKSIASSSNL